MDVNSETKRFIKYINQCPKLHSFVFHNKHWCLAIDDLPLYYLIMKIKKDSSFNIKEIDFEEVRHMIFSLDSASIY